MLQGEPLTFACSRSGYSAQRTPTGLLSHLGMQTWKALPLRKALCLCHSHDTHVRLSRSSLLSRSAYPHLSHLLLWRKQGVENSFFHSPYLFLTVNSASGSFSLGGVRSGQQWALLTLKTLFYCPFNLWALRSWK